MSLLSSSSSTTQLFVAFITLVVVIFTPGTRAGCPLDSASFELVTQTTHFLLRDGNLLASFKVRLEERYSGDQSRGIVKLRAYGLNDWLAAYKDARLDFEAGTFFFDAQENISLQFMDGTGGCKRVHPSELQKLAGVYFVPADEKDSWSEGHLIGSARWLKYFCEKRRELKAELSHLSYEVRNVPSVQYKLSFVDANSGSNIEVSVYYSEDSLTAENHDTALPDRIVINSRGSNIVSMMDISPVKFIASGETFTESSQTTGLELDEFLLAPASCHALIFTSVAHQPIFGRDRTRRASFNARITRTHHSTTHEEREHAAQVTYDGYLNTMRVDLSTPSQTIKCSKNIFNFHRNKMHQILERNHMQRNTRLLDHLIDGGHYEDDNADENTPLAFTPQPSLYGTDDDHHERALTQELLVGGGDDPARSSTCASAQIMSIASWHLYSLGQLLLGSDSFVYIGRARVRGIRALVYVAVGSELPYWLEAQVDVADASNQAGSSSKANKDDPPSSNKLMQLVTRLYVSEVASDHPDEDSQILLMELFQMDQSYKYVYDKRTVAIHDFSWSLQSIRSICASSSHDDDDDDDDDDDSLGDPSSLFSLADRCYSGAKGDGPGEQEHGHFEMLIESIGREALMTSSGGGSGSSCRMLAPSELKLSLLNAFQKGLNLMVDMIYGLEARLISGGSLGGEQPQGAPAIRLVASFDMARHSNATTGLAYVGLGYRLKGKSVALRVNSLHQCFMLAAHRRAELDLAYDDRSNLCFLGTTTTQTGQTFELTGVGNLRVYQTRKFEIAQRGVLDSFLDARNVEAKHARLRDKRLSLTPFGDAEFLVKRFHFSHHESHQQQQQQLQAATPAKQLLGFGLIEQASVNQLVKSTTGGGEDDDDDDGSESTVAGEHREEITLDQCQASCMANFDCKSVSYCVRGAQVECIRSLVDFSEPELVSRVLDASGSSSDKLFTIEVSLKNRDTTTTATTRISLIKYPNCAIYNKQYVQYYNRDAFSPLTTLQFVSLARASSAEECARTCFALNLETLRAHHQLLASSLERLDHTITSGGREDAQEDALRALERLEGVNAKMRHCEGFHYVRLLRLLEMQTNETIAKLKRFATATNAQVSFEVSASESVDGGGGGGGLCVLSNKTRRPTFEEFRETPRLSFDPEENLEFDYYQFNMENLYDEEHGVRLRVSQLTNDEAFAYSDVRAVNLQRSPRANQQVRSIEIVKRLLRQGENFQVMTTASRYICASLCFKQSLGVWPACRSFDLLVELSPLGHALVKCALNSMTKRQLLERKRADLIESASLGSSAASEEPPRSIQDFWHYEPKAGLLADESTLELEGAVWGLLRQLSNSGGGAISSLEFFRNELLFFLITTGIGMGLFLGIMLMEFAKSRGYVSRGRAGQQARPRGDSISSTRALDLDDHLELPPIQEEEQPADSTSGR